LSDQLPHHLQLLQPAQMTATNNPFELEAKFGNKWVIYDEVIISLFY
jgi:hypothetical protein